MKLYLWLCIVCILLASLPLPLPLVPILVLLFVSVSAVSHVSVCLSVCSVFRLPRVLSHCLCVQLPSAIRRMLTLTLPNALQPLPLLPPLTLPSATQMSSQKKRKNVPRCILLRWISNIPHVATFFFSVSFGLGFFCGFFVALGSEQKQKYFRNVRQICKAVREWQKLRERRREKERDAGRERKREWVMQKIRIYRLGARKLDLDMDMDMLCGS